jgi:hypothetical protein
MTAARPLLLIDAGGGLLLYSNDLFPGLRQKRERPQSTLQL